MLRNPAVAGQFYPASKKQLICEIEKHIDREASKEKILGVVSPHAGYMCSGETAALTLSKVEIPDNIIILGPNHIGAGARFSIMAHGAWKTPMDNVNINENLAKIILSKTGLIKEEEEAQIYEHSIEVQLPIIQYLRNDFEFVPIVVSYGDIEQYQEIGYAIAGAIEDFKKEVLIIASSDMTHYESAETAKTKDNLAIESILKLNEVELFSRVHKHGISMCGCGSACIMLTACKKLGAKDAELVKYTNSGEVTGDFDQVVGYAGILIK
ncbi:AmmeMemoRadiSam system protein B [bacterium]|nr:AmmeMemoRadiSam system protein B [bacterium]